MPGCIVVPLVLVEFCNLIADVVIDVRLWYRAFFWCGKQDLTPGQSLSKVECSTGVQLASWGLLTGHQLMVTMYQSSWGRPSDKKCGSCHSYTILPAYDVTCKVMFDNWVWGCAG